MKRLLIGLLNNMKNEISEILIKWDMPTRQRAIDEIIELFNKRVVDFIDTHYLEYCRTQNGINQCKSCGLCISDIKELLK